MTRNSKLPTIEVQPRAGEFGPDGGQMFNVLYAGRYVGELEGYPLDPWQWHGKLTAPPAAHDAINDAVKNAMRRACDRAGAVAKHFPAETVFAKYAVAPWSRVPKSQRGTQSDADECCICGRVVRQPVAHWAVVVNGGATWGDAQSDETDGGYMGCFAVGPDCHKRYVIAASVPRRANA